MHKLHFRHRQNALIKYQGMLESNFLFRYVRHHHDK